MIEEALLVAAAATGVSSAIGLAQQAVARRREARAATALKDSAAPSASVDTDPRDTNAYLIQKLGPLTLREYASDPEARDAVARAVSRVDDLLEHSTEPTESQEDDQQGLPAARRALAAGDVIGALARMRLAIELTLRDASQVADIAASRRVPTHRTLERLRGIQVVSPDDARALSHGVRIASAALHGESVTAEEAARALDQTEHALARLQLGLRERF